MKLQHRNLVTIWYALYHKKEPILDEKGYRTGQEKIIYQQPVSLECSVSTAAGQSLIEMFGNLESYDKIVITDDLTCPIDENSVMFIDRKPDEKGRNYDYLVKRKAKSLNFIFYAVSKVTVTAS